MNNTNFKDALSIVAHRQDYITIRQKRIKKIFGRLLIVCLMFIFVVGTVVVIKFASKKQMNIINDGEILINPNGDSTATFLPETTNTNQNSYTPGIDSTPAIDSTDGVPANATPHMPTEDPPGWSDRSCIFYSFDDFNKGIKSGELETLKHCSFYYEPENARDNLTLDYIQASESSVCLYYFIDSSEGRINYISEWYLQIKADQLKSAIIDHFAFSFLEQSGYYILNNESAELIEVFWKQDEGVFHAMIPWGVQFDELSRLCKMKKVFL